MLQSLILLVSLLHIYTVHINDTIANSLGVCIHWTGLLDWTTGLDYWTGLLDWTTGLDYWTGLLDWNTGLTLELTFELFFLSMIRIAVVLLDKLNLGVLGK